MRGKGKGVSWYCDVAKGHPIHGPYHDTEYGFPLSAENALFERLALEIFQAGLSWILILKKRAAIGRAFAGFDVDAVAAFDARDIERLLNDPQIIRNRLKICAIVENARRIQSLRAGHGSFARWVTAHHPRVKNDWVRLFKKTFKFTGGEITGEFLMSIGYLPGTHREDCPVYGAILALSPPWMEAGRAFYEQDAP